MTASWRPRRARSAPPRPPHFPPTARNCIFIFLAGGTSQVELFDPKPKLVSIDRPEAAGLVLRQGAILLDQARPGPGDGKPVRLPAVRAKRARDVRVAPPHRRMCRRHRAGALDAHRPVRPRAGGDPLQHRHRHARPAEHRRLGHLRPGERVAGPPRLRGAGDRPRAGGQVAHLGQRIPADRPRRRALPGARRAGAEPLEPGRDHRGDAAPPARRDRAAQQATPGPDPRPRDPGPHRVL